MPLRSVHRVPIAPRSSPSGPRGLPRCLFQTQRRWASKKPQEPDSPEREKPMMKKWEPKDMSFRDAMFESMAQRIAREKKEVYEYDKMIRQSARGRYISTVFLVLAAAGIGYYWGRVLPQDPETNSTLPLEDTLVPVHDISDGNMEAGFVDMETVVGRENITLEKSELESHSGSAWSSHPSDPEALPFCVVRPKNTLEVSVIMKICHDRKIPVTAYSGGTSLEGHFAATRGGVCIDFSRMDKILKLHPEDLDVVVQPAVGWETLNEELAKSNLFFPPDPGPGAQIGGMIGTGCSGTNAYRYGTMKDWVLSLTVVMADGTIIKTRQRPRKSSAGYDLTRLFVGSEGTLGLVTEATLKVAVKPQHTSVAVCAFKSVKQAANCVSRVVGAGVPIAAVEILDDTQMACINDAGTTHRTWKNAPTLFFKFAGTPNAVKEQIAQVQTLASRAGSVSFEFAKNEAEREELWQARKEALWSVMAKGGGNPDMAVWTTDVAVPISKLPDIIEETQQEIKKSGLLASIVGHVGDGNFHSIILYDRNKDYAKAKHLVHTMVKRAIEMEGTATGEHGVGLVKRDYLPHELGEETVDAMRRLKRAYDPLCLLNCDKVVRAEKPKPGEVEPW